MHTKIPQLLKKHFIDTGTQKKWFAEKIGMHPNFFYQVLCGKLAFPMRYWRSVVFLTRGKITLTDLLDAYLGYPETIEFQENMKVYECKFSLPDFNLKRDY